MCFCCGCVCQMVATDPKGISKRRINKVKTSVHRKHSTEFTMCWLHTFRISIGNWSGGVSSRFQKSFPQKWKCIMTQSVKKTTGLTHLSWQRGMIHMDFPIPGPGNSSRTLWKHQLRSHWSSPSSLMHLLGSEHRGSSFQSECLHSHTHRVQVHRRVLPLLQNVFYD